MSAPLIPVADDHPLLREADSVDTLSLLNPGMRALDPEPTRCAPRDGKGRLPQPMP